MKTQKGGDTLREMEEERQKGRKKGRELLKTKDFIHIPVNLTGLVFMLSPECKHEVKSLKKWLGPSASYQHEEP